MNQKPYRILALDGGGIRGLVTIVLLERLEALCPGWLDQVDLLAGTSTGGIIALGLAHGLSLAKLRALYEVQGPAIFDDTWLDDLTDLGRLRGAEYDNRKLSQALRRMLGDARLRDLRKRVLIPAFDLDNENLDPVRRMWAPKFFHNFPGRDSDGDRLAYRVALYTSAAPAYFPSVDGFIDGGVCANNPSMAALAQSQDRRAMRNPPGLDRIALLSVGTGTARTRIEGRDLDWGLLQWAKPLLGVMLDGSMGVADYECRQLLGRRYHRLAPAFPPGQSIALDDVKRIPDLVHFAQNVRLGGTARWLSRAWTPANANSKSAPIAHAPTVEPGRPETQAQRLGRRLRPRA